MSDFFSRKRAWHLAVLRDGKLSPLAVRVAGVLEIEYFNGKSEKAWPGVESLADELGTDRRNVRRAIDKLVEAGFLDRKVSCGRGSPNTYRIPSGFAYEDHEKGGADAPYYYEKGGATTPVCEPKRARSDTEKGARTPPDKERIGESPSGTPRRARAGRSDFTSGADGPPAKRTREESICKEKEGSHDRPAAKRSVPRSSERRKQQKTVFPEEWVCGSAECEVAASIAGWDPARAEQEFEECRNWYNERPHLRFVDWTPRWESWCRKGTEIDARKAAQQADRGSGSRRGNGRADQVNATNEALHGLYEEYARRAQQAKGD